ncbi:hypothetical protein SAMN05660772_01835 [Pasteurella testudinis DSM 23072]|uniref:Uncharacterized protein n=1 Tax=Pasteurella testudinis DSM 23072 TaxID=1122938 RepID=A0A1W1UJV5_9PAST|nr:hypothetical protein [Pasteurella testudinis]SMB81398.1 hypothetical protein SAMN05660772_01835 [Pasteurella testudinis DSM 23072]SUB51393.1 Uncharacterised protein [Pasteurella testudinis]
MVTPETERNLLNEVLFEHPDAVEFCIALGRLSQVVDDLIDCDEPITKMDVVHAFHTALVTIPMNPFYRENIDALAPLLTLTFADYIASVEMEGLSKHDQTLAFVLRDSLVSVVIGCMEILGGGRYAMENTLRVRQFFHDETLEDYLEDK